MPVVISMLRGINVGAHNRIKMDALREVYELLGLREVQTYVQSGNVVFSTVRRDLAKLADALESALEERFGFRPSVILRTPPEMKEVIDRNPFADRTGLDPAKLLVLFLASDPGEEARKKVAQMNTAPDELRMEGRELYVYFPDGMGRSKLPWASLGKMLGSVGTGRNWNTVLKLLALAERLT